MIDGESARHQAHRLGLLWPGLTTASAPNVPEVSRRYAELAAVVDEWARPLTMLATLWMWDPAGVEAILPRKKKGRHG